MKYSDIMLDSATGDNIGIDGDIQYAIARINESAAIYALESKICVLPEGEQFMCVQEAAEVGLPTNKAEACGVSCEAIKQQLEAYYDLVVSTAKKVQTVSEKNMKLLVAFGKKNGVTMSGDITTFASGLVQTVAGATFSDDKFIKGKYAAKTAKAYAKGMSYMMAAFGMNITDKFDSTVSKMVGTKFNSEGVSTLSAVEDKLSDGAKMIKIEKITSKDSHYTDKIRENDLIEFTVSLYTILNVSKAVAEVAGRNKKSAVSNLKACCDASTDKAKKLSRACDAINDNIKDWSANLTTIVDSISTAFGDSVYALNDIK